MWKSKIIAIITVVSLAIITPFISAQANEFDFAEDSAEVESVENKQDYSEIILENISEKNGEDEGLKDKKESALDDVVSKDVIELEQNFYENSDENMDFQENQLLETEENQENEIEQEILENSKTELEEEVEENLEITDFEEFDESAVTAESSNSSFAAAQTISLGTTYSGNLTSSSDYRFFQFTLPKDGAVSFSFSHAYIDSSWVYWKISLYDSNYSFLQEEEYRGDTSATITSSRIGLPAGKYYLKIGNYNYSGASFKFKVNYEENTCFEKELNDSFLTATPIKLNTTYIGNIMEGSDEDYYKFVIPENGYITIDFQHGYIDSSRNYWKIKAYDQNKADLFEREYCGNKDTPFTSAKFGFPAGTYYIKIDDVNYSDIEYQFKVNYTSSSVYEKEFNDSFASANSIKLNTVYYGNLMEYSDRDYYKFTTTSDGCITIDFQHSYLESSWKYWTLELYNQSKEKMLTRDYTGSIDTLCRTTKLGLPAGTYYILIKCSSHSDIEYMLRANFTAGVTNT